MPPSAQARSANMRWALAKALFTTVCAIFGMVLLVAGKSTAGIALLCSAVIAQIPLGRLTAHRWLAVWPRIVLVAVLCMVAIGSVATTDIVPDQTKTGIKFVDQILAIGHRFQANIVGEEPERGAYPEQTMPIRSNE